MRQCSRCNSIDRQIIKSIARELWPRGSCLSDAICFSNRTAGATTRLIFAFITLNLCVWLGVSTQGGRHSPTESADLQKNKSVPVLKCMHSTCKECSISLRMPNVLMLRWSSNVSIDAVNIWWTGGIRLVSPGKNTSNSVSQQCSRYDMHLLFFHNLIPCPLFNPVEVEGLKKHRDL